MKDLDDLKEDIRNAVTLLRTVYDEVDHRLLDQYVAVHGYGSVRLSDALDNVADDLEKSL